MAFEHFGSERLEPPRAAVTTGSVKAWLMLSSSSHARL